MFERKVYADMIKWKNEYAPRYALFLKGARRVGKTTLAEKLGKEMYRSYIVVRFDQTTAEIEDLFVHGLRDLDYFFNTLQLEYETRLYPRESLTSSCMDNTLEAYIPLTQYIREMFFKLFSFVSFIGGTGKKWRDIKELDYFYFQSSI